jgi:hypothetical protein
MVQDVRGIQERGRRRGTGPSEINAHGQFI